MVLQPGTPHANPAPNRTAASSSGQAGAVAPNMASQMVPNCPSQNPQTAASRDAHNSRGLGTTKVIAAAPTATSNTTGPCRPNDVSIGPPSGDPSGSPA